MPFIPQPQIPIMQLLLAVPHKAWNPLIWPALQRKDVSSYAGW